MQLVDSYELDSEEQDTMRLGLEAVLEVLAMPELPDYVTKRILGEAHQLTPETVLQKLNREAEPVLSRAEVLAVDFWTWSTRCYLRDRTDAEEHQEQFAACEAACDLSRNIQEVSKFLQATLNAALDLRSEWK